MSATALTAGRMNKTMKTKTDKAKLTNRKNTPPSVKAALEEVCHALAVISEGYSNAADNLPENLQGSMRHDELQEAGDAVQQIAEALEDVVGQIEEVDCLDYDDEPSSQPRPKLAEATVKVSKLPWSSSKPVLFRRCEQVVDEVTRQVSAQWPEFAELLNELDWGSAMI